MTRRLRRLRELRPLRLLPIVLAALALLLPSWARAHEVGLSRGDFVIEGAAITAEITFAQRDLAGLAPELDRDKNDNLTEQELTQGRDAVLRAVVARVVIKGDGAACPGQLVSARPVEGDGITVKATYTCSAPPGEVDFDLEILEDLAYGHRHIFRAGGGPRLHEAILYRKRRTFQVLTAPAPPAAPAPAAAPGAATPSASPAPPARPEAPAGSLEMFAMGIEHILLGLDHLVFLLGLVLVGGRWRAILLVVTAFTVAHSITLALAVLDVWAPSPRIVEPAIALSIAYVGVENRYVKDAEGRWRITFPFGLIHGFGFAGALREIALPSAAVPKALLLFNLGVEAGQIAVLAVVLPLLAYARRREWLTPKAVRIASMLILLAGAAWFVERVVGG